MVRTHNCGEEPFKRRLHILAIRAMISVNSFGRVLSSCAYAKITEESIVTLSSKPENSPPGSPLSANHPTDPAADSAEGAPAESALTETSLSDKDKRLLLQVARQTLEGYLESGRQPHFSSDSPALNQPRAVFVTLWQRDTGELRGCRGESMARRPLIEAVSAMAIASAVDDPRFYPVAPGEVPQLRIEINALTPLHPIRPDEVEVGRHGLMVMRGARAGLLLPDVPVRFDWNRLEFLEGVCQKAGLPRHAWQDPDVQLLGFESEEWGEEGE